MQSVTQNGHKRCFAEFLSVQMLRWGDVWLSSYLHSTELLSLAEVRRSVTFPKL